MAYNRTVTTTIGSGEATATVNLSAGPDKSQPLTLVGIITPSSIDGDNLAFEGSVDDNTYAPINYDGNPVTLSITGSTAYTLDPVIFAPYKHVRLTTQTGSTTQNQSAERTLAVIAREVS